MQKVSYWTLFTKNILDVKLDDIFYYGGIVQVALHLEIEYFIQII